MEAQTTSEKNLFFRSATTDRDVLIHKLEMLIRRKSMSALEFNVLIIDNNDDLSKIETMLTPIFQGPIKLQIQKASSYHETTIAIKDNDFDVCFLGNRLGSQTGGFILKWAQKQAPDQNIVLIADDNDNNAAKLASKYGAVEYFGKSALSTDLLLQCIYLIMYLKPPTSRQLFIRNGSTSFLIHLDSTIKLISQ